MTEIGQSKLLEGTPSRISDDFVNVAMVAADIDY